MNEFRRNDVRYGRTPVPTTSYRRDTQVWDDRIGSARVPATNWRLMTLGDLSLIAALAGALVWQATRGSVTPWVVQVERLGQAQAVAPAERDYRPSDGEIAWHLSRFVKEVRSVRAYPVVVRKNWLNAYDFTIDKGALALNG